MMASLDELRWWRLRTTLECRRTPPQGESNLLEVLNALVKQAGSGEANPKRAFHVPGVRLRRHQPPRQGQRYALDVLLFERNATARERWRERFLAETNDTARSNFSVVEAAALEERSLATLPDVAIGPSQEVCLDFLSPLRFTPPSKGERLRLREAQFLELLAHRLGRLFNIEIAPPVAATEIELLPYYWHYEEIRHRAKSQRGTVEYYNGCIGPLYLRGQLEPLLPWLQVAQEVHAGGKLDVNPFGYFQLHVDPRPWFDGALLDRKAMADTAAEVLSRDDAAEEVAARLGSAAGPQQLAEDALAALQRSASEVEPNEAFRLAKGSARGGTRIVERLGVLEKTVQRRLLDLLGPVVDQALHPSSVGYRKGRSREHAVARVRELVEEGYRYAVQSDIEDCFPSVDLDRLEREIEKVLPRADAQILAILKARLRTPYVLDGTRLERRSGLAQGSPLSPLLANLYLDAFDDGLAGERGVLIRYADDFVILCRTRDDAEAMLVEARDRLDVLGLSLSDAKTAVRSIDEGFRFLGETFDERGLEDPGEAALVQRKPLVVTESYCLLSVNGDALDIRLRGKMLDTIPLRRVSEIVVLGKAVFSSALVERCSRLGIPVSFTLETGYQVGMFTPDSRRFHDIAFRQSRKYYDLSSTERVAIAQHIAATKVANYMALVRQRYAAGDAELLANLRRSVDAMASCELVAQLRGHEGTAARLVFAWLNQRIQDPAMRARRRDRNAADALNALLNFGYYLSWSRLNGLVRASGLNPYLGFLHEGRDNFETLVADLQELFRAHVDRLVLRLLNTGVVGSQDFAAGGSRLRIARPAVRRYVAQFEREMQRRLPGTRLTLADMMSLQVRGMRTFMLDEGPLWLYRWPVRSAVDALEESTDSGPDTEAGAGLDNAAGGDAVEPGAS
jgi:CRISPR-associated protein Cas1